MILLIFVLCKYASYEKHHSSIQLAVSHVLNFNGGNDSCDEMIWMRDLYVVCIVFGAIEIEKFLVSQKY